MNKTIFKTEKDFVCLRDASIMSNYYIYNCDVDEVYVGSDGITPLGFKSKTKAIINAVYDGDIVISYSQLPSHIKMFLR